MEQTEAQQAQKKYGLWLLLEGLLLLVLLPVGAAFLLYRQVRPVTEWELTGGCPPASALLRDGGAASYDFDPDRLDWTGPTDAWVLVKTSFLPRIALVRVRDTQAPTARGVDRVLGVDEELGPDSFITDLADRQLVAVAFEQAPRFHTAGEYPVVIRLEDLSGNVGFVEARCTILGAVPRLTIEAGEAVPPLAAFMPNDTVTGRFLTDVEQVDTREVGVHTILVEAEGQTFETALVVEDTVPPVLSLREGLFALLGEPLAPKSLVAFAADATELTYSFATEPDWNAPGYQTLTVVATDKGGNRTAASATVLISRLRPLTWEASRRRISGLALEAAQRALDGSFSEEIRVAHFVPRALGCFDINTLVGEEPSVQRLFVVDRVAPKIAFLSPLTGYLDHPLAPEALLGEIEDETELTFAYVTEPDWSLAGEQPVAVEAADAGGNVTRIEGTIRVVPDTEPPQIFGAVNRYVYIGEAISYFAQVSATDNADEEVSLTVDNSAVNIYKTGACPVIYRAVDRAGNMAEKKVYLYFIQPGISEEKLEKKADEVLAAIVTDEMTMGQKAYAIFRYVKDNYRYREKSNKYDWKYEAWRGFTKKQGDCFTYCAAAKYLLDRIGAKTMFVARYSKAHHYWLMVDVGQGWYHFDPLNSGPTRKYECFMRTTKELQEEYAFFWKYDHKIYPDTPATRFKRDW